MNNNIKILPPQDVIVTLSEITEPVAMTLLDPWYNRGVGGEISNYDSWLQKVVTLAANISQHVFVWGFPEIVCHVLDKLPENYSLTAWLTWYYKNCPSVIRGWRSAQYACIHLSKKGSKLYPEHFLTDEQLERKKNGKLRFIPGPPTVIEAPLNIGFVGKKEQTGHPAQKPEKVIEPLVLMTTEEGDTVIDPMCGAGTTGVVCARFKRKSILCDKSNDWLEVTRKRILEGLDEKEDLCGAQGDLYAEIS